MEFSEEAFRNMNRLRLLELNLGEDNLVGAPNYLPNSLRWLDWYEYPGKSLPGNFQPSNLVNLNLSWSPTLETFPDITCMPNLEFLNLSGCKELLEVPPSLAVHKKLIQLDLSSCRRLNKFRRIEMESLETLTLIRCSELQSLPEFHNNMIRLRTLNLGGMVIKEFPWSVGRLTSLQELTMYGCHPLPNSLLENRDDEGVDCFFNTQPSSLERKRKRAEEDYDIFRRFILLFNRPPSLRKVNMEGRKVSEIIFAERIGCLTSLQELHLNDNCNIISLPESINRFSSLQVLRLRNCRNLEALTELPSSIMVLDLEGCRELTSIPHPVDLLHKYQNLCMLSLVDCKQLANQFLLGPWDWIPLRNVLSRRQEALQLYLPHMETFNGLYEKIGSNATVTLPPSWYNDKLQGFLIFAISYYPGYKVAVIDDLFNITIIPIRLFDGLLS